MNARKMRAILKISDIKISDKKIAIVPIKDDS